MPVDCQIQWYAVTSELRRIYGPVSMYETRHVAIIGWILLAMEAERLGYIGHQIIWHQCVLKLQRVYGKQRNAAPDDFNSLWPSDAYLQRKLTIIGPDNGLSPGRHGFGTG